MFTLEIKWVLRLDLKAVQESIDLSDEEGGNTEEEN